MYRTPYSTGPCHSCFRENTPSMSCPYVTGPMRIDICVSVMQFLHVGLCNFCTICIFCMLRLWGPLWLSSSCPVLNGCSVPLHVQCIGYDSCHDLAAAFYVLESCRFRAIAISGTGQTDNNRHVTWMGVRLILQVPGKAQ